MMARRLAECGVRGVGNVWCKSIQCCVATRGMATEAVPTETASTVVPQLPKVAALNLNDTEFMRLCLPKSTANQLTTGGKMEVLERQPTQAALDKLTASSEAGAAETARIALVGEQGLGKSTGLASVARECRANGWVVAYVPDASLWCDSLQSIEVSKRNPDRLDQFIASKEWLAQFVAQNGDTLGDIGVAGTYEWDTPLNVDGLDTIKALAEFGINALDENGDGDATIAADVVGVVLKELRREDLGVPVLVAVDVYNAWLRDAFPKWKDFDSKVVTRERSALIRHFTKITEAPAGSKPLGAGGVVVAESAKGGEVALQELVGFDKLEYQAYFDDEVHALLDHFAQQGYIPQMTPQQRMVLRLILSSKPREFRKHLSSL